MKDTIIKSQMKLKWFKQKQDKWIEWKIINKGYLTDVKVTFVK